MKYRLKTDHDVTVEVGDLGGSETVEIPVSVFDKVFELVPGNDWEPALKELLKNWPSE